MTRRRRGYTLVVALAILFFLLTLALALYQSSGASANLMAMNRRNLARATLAESTLSRLGLLMQGHRTGEVSLTENFRVQENGYQATVTWAEGSGSVRGRSLYDPALGKHLLDSPSQWEKLPQAGYDPELAVKGLGGVEAPPESVATGLDFTGGARYLSVFQRGFPFAAYAPLGVVTLDRVGSFTNPTFEDGPDAAQQAGLPVWLLARHHVHASQFPYGRAWSELGPVNVRGGAVALTGPLPPDAFGRALTRQAEAAMALSRDGLDKTDALIGHLLTPQVFVDFLEAPEKAAMILLRGLSLQQATMVPLIPIPTVQVGPVVVIQIHHPWPPDFGDRDDAGELRDRMVNLQKRDTDLETEQGGLRKEIEALEKQIRDNPKDPRVGEWRGQISQKQESLRQSQERQKGVRGELAEVGKELNRDAWSRGLIRGKVPRNWWGELDYNTIGWTYLGPIEQFLNSLIDLVEGNWQQSIARLATVTRVVHLGWDDPEFYFPDGQPTVRDWDPVRRPANVPANTLSMKATVTVPPGRTLKIRSNVQIRGDLWIQRGASLYVAGNLQVTPPDRWLNFTGQNVPENSPVFPNGRVFLEEGATLVVDGNLDCGGGTPQSGSVIVTGPVGRVNPVTSAILCRGSFTSRHGVHPGSTLLDLLVHRSQEKEYLKGGTDFLWHLSFIAPAVSRAAGPFSFRMPWFSKFTTTFVIIPKLYKILLGGPWPIPLPLANCYPDWFMVLSGASSLQLNMRLGPTFYTQSWPLWVFGRGVVPVINKVNPALLWPRIDSLAGAAPVIAWEVLGPALGEFAAGMAKEALVQVVVAIGTKIVNNLLSSVIPFNAVSCLSFSWKEEGQKPPHLVVKLLTDLSGSYVLGLVATGNAVALIVQEELVKAFKGEPEALAREMPGLFIWSGGQMRIGLSPQGTPLASGFFVSRHTLHCNARLTVGALASLEGRVQAHNLYYNPYFTRVTLYNPVKPSQYAGVPSSPLLPIDEVKDLVQVPLVPVNEAAPIEIGVPFPRVLTRGWSR